MHRLCVFIPIILIAGCMVQTPATPPFTLPDSFSISGEATPDRQWWRHFNSTELDLAVEEALGNNLTIKTAIARIEEIKASTQQAGAALLPTAEINSATSLQQKNSSASNKNFSLGIAASYEVDLWGRLRSIRDAATAKLLASRKALDVAALSIAAETATTWLMRQENRMQQLLVRQQQEINRKTETIIEFRVRTGQTGIADLLQQRQLVQKDEATLAALAARGTQLDHRLNILKGQPPQIASPPPQQKMLPQLPPLPATGIPLQLLQQRPDVHQAWLALKAADQYTAAAIANRLPSLSLRTGIETTAPDGRELFANWLTSITANLLAPVFDGDSRKTEVMRRKAIARQQYHQWTATMLHALQEVEDALVEERSLMQQLESKKQQLRLAQNTVEALGRRYRQGAADYQRVLQATLSAQQLEKTLLNTRLQLLCKRIDLYRALSGGLPDTLFHQEEWTATR